MFAGAAGKVGVKVSSEKVLDHQKGAPVDFKGSAGGGRNAEANLAMSRQSPGYVPAKGLIADLLDRGGDSMLLEFAAQNVPARYQIDGVWHNVDPLQREACRNDRGRAENSRRPGPRRTRQTPGRHFCGRVPRRKIQLQAAQPGAQTGERVAVSLYPHPEKGAHVG